MGFQVSRRTALCLWRPICLDSGQGQQITDHPANRKNNHGCNEKSEADHGLAPILEYRLQLTRPPYDMSKSGILCRDKNGAVPAKIDGKPSIASRYRRIQLFFLSALQGRE